MDEQGEDHSQNVIHPHDDDVELDTDEAKPTNLPNMPAQVICSSILVTETYLC